MNGRHAAPEVRIVSDPAILEGRPHVAGTTADVEFILISLRDGVTPKHLHRETGLTADGIRAAVRHAVAQGHWPSLVKAPGVRPWLAK